MVSLSHNCSALLFPSMAYFRFFREFPWLHPIQMWWVLWQHSPSHDRSLFTFRPASPESTVTSPVPGLWGSSVRVCDIKQWWMVKHIQTSNGRFWTFFPFLFSSFFFSFHFWRHISSSLLYKGPPATTPHMGALYFPYEKNSIVH